jgi:hypothetical protein
MCKPWTMNGFARGRRSDGARIGDHRRRPTADADLRTADGAAAGPIGI